MKKMKKDKGKKLPADLEAIRDGILKMVREGASMDEVMKEAEKLILGEDE